MGNAISAEGYESLNDEMKEILKARYEDLIADGASEEEAFAELSRKKPLQLGTQVFEYLISLHSCMYMLSFTLYSMCTGATINATWVGLYGDDGLLRKL